MRLLPLYGIVLRPPIYGIRARVCGTTRLASIRRTSYVDEYGMRPDIAHAHPTVKACNDLSVCARHVLQSPSANQILSIVHASDVRTHIQNVRSADLARNS